MARFIRPTTEIIDIVNGSDIIKKIENIGRVCYKSENKITDDSAYEFIENIINRGHESVIEHQSISARVICDRGVTHEIVRHRIASFSQESTRYCNYKGGVTFIIPPWVDMSENDNIVTDNLDGISIDPVSKQWLTQCVLSEITYIHLLATGWSPQKARSVLPNSFLIKRI